MPVAISGAAISVAETEADSAPAPVAPEALAPLRASAGRIITNPAPFYSRSWFIALQAISAGGLLAAGVFAIGRRRHHDPSVARRRATRMAIDTQRGKLAIARQQQDGDAFFTCARRALQHRLAEKWGCPAEAITTEDISQRLPQDSAIARVFAMADAVEFSGVRPDPDSYEEWQSRIGAALAAIDAPATITAEHKQTWGEVPQPA
jgi:hypothetical protein